jgi:hypothetical protein
LLVFDRQVGPVFQGGSDAARWDGGHAGQEVYTWLLSYRNTLTSGKGQLESEVTLLK